VTIKSSLEDDPGVLERLDAGEPPSSPAEAQARAPYEQLIERIRDLEDAVPPAGWEDRAAARWSSARRKRRFGIAIGAAVAVGLAAALLLKPCSKPSAPQLEVAILTNPGATRRGDPAVGDLLRVRARLDQAHVQLRIYLGIKLIARCPGSEPCKRDASALTLDWTLAEAGAYQVVVLSSPLDLPVPSDGTSDRDLLEAREAGWTIEVRHLTVSL
jgi:hypothetical protein